MKVLTRLRYTELLALLSLALMLGLAQSSNAQSASFFMSCSTTSDAGIDTYFTDVFQTELTIKPPRGPGGGKFTVDGKTLDPSSIQLVLDHFQAYLTQKGYKFKPGAPAACDIKSTEDQAKAAKHKRAYEGSPCSTCGKVVETGWKPSD